MTASMNRKPKAAAPDPERRTARLFTNGASQAVRLPKEFRMEGSEVRIWKDGNRVVLEPIDNGWEPLFAAIRAMPADFQIERNQPPMQERDWAAFGEVPVSRQKQRRKS